MSDPIDEKLKESGKEGDESVVNIGDENEADDSKAHLINANGGAGGDVDHLGGVDVKIVDGTATSSEAEVSFNGLGKDEVLKYADEPFWKRLRLILFILFWVGWLAMLVTAIIIIVLAPRCPPRPDLKWYQTDTVYQVLPEAFKDSDGDGKGDFQGLKDKSKYVYDDLKVNAIWLSTMYEADKDEPVRGVVNHKALADWFGATRDDIKSWMKTLKKEDKRVILDLIPNQTSKKHEWFIKSVAEEGKYTNYYVWVPNTNGTAPNNWQSVYGGSAWELDTKRNAWYLHQFSKDTPDLNLLNPDVLDEIKDIMRYWLGAGVSGFHVRDVEYLVENPMYKDNDANSSQTFNYRDTLTILSELRKVVAEFSDKPGQEKVLFATLQDTTGNEILEYFGPKDQKLLHIVAPVMKSLDAKTTASDLKTWLESCFTDDRYQWLGYAVGSPDVSRIATRMGSTTKLSIAHALQLLMPGTPFNYYGDEFGQHDGTMQGSDKYRTPMQWNSDENAGFTTGTPYLAIGSDYKINHVNAGSALFSENTPLQLFKKLVELREEESFQFGKTKLCAPDDELLLFTRAAERFPPFLTLINMGDSRKTVQLENLDCVVSKAKGTVRFHSQDKEVDEVVDVHENAIKLDGGDIIVIEFAA